MPPLDRDERTAARRDLRHGRFVVVASTVDPQPASSGCAPPPRGPAPPGSAEGGLFVIGDTHKGKPGAGRAGGQAVRGQKACPLANADPSEGFQPLAGWSERRSSSKSL
jgi:hypothetical protein